MTPRADFLAILLRNRRRLDAERREFARRAVEILERNSRPWPTFGFVAYVLTMRELEGLLSEFYGAFPGDERARFWRLILAECRAVRALEFQRAVADVRRRLRREPALLRAIREDAAS